MKKIKFVLLLLVCAFCLSTPLTLNAATATTTAAKTRGLITKNGKYYYILMDGTMAKRRWLSIKGYRYYFGSTGAAVASTSTKTPKIQTINGKRYAFDYQGHMLKRKWATIGSYRFYFGSTGAACTGTTANGKKTPKVYSINGKKYAFDTLGHMLKGTYYINNTFYVFSSSTGAINSTWSLRLRSAAKAKDATLLMARLKTINVKPIKTDWFGYSCYGSGEDGMIYYKNFYLSVYRDNANSKVQLLGVISK